MIDNLLRWIVTRMWRRRIAKHEQRAQWTAEFMAWKRANPDRCMYCAYTRWANTEQGVKMKLDPHTCVEGKSPPESPQELPRAQLVEDP